MRPAEDIEKLLKDINIDTNAETDDAVLGDVFEAFEKSKNKKTSAFEQNMWRIIMKSKITKLAAAAVIIIAIMLGMYVMTGSFDGTSITMAQVRQAMENIDWVQMVGRAEEGSMSAWYSFGSKVAIYIYSEGRILYRDFNACKELVWNPGGEAIYESDIDEDRQFAGGVRNVYAGFTKMFDSMEAKGEYKVTKEIGTYQGQKVEIWTGRRIKGESGPTHTELFTMYIDVDKKLPIAAMDVKKGADGDIKLNVEFKYPEAGPADIYEAGAPRTAQIKPAKDQ